MRIDDLEVPIFSETPIYCKYVIKKTSLSLKKYFEAAISIMTFPQPGAGWSLFSKKNYSIILWGYCSAVATECGDFQQCHRCSTAERCNRSMTERRQHRKLRHQTIDRMNCGGVNLFAIASFEYHSHTLSLCLNFMARQHLERHHLPPPLMCSHELSWQEATVRHLILGDGIWPWLWPTRCHSYRFFQRLDGNDITDAFQCFVTMSFFHLPFYI